MDGKIVKQFTKFIYPFKYHKPDTTCRIFEEIQSSKGNPIRIWDCFGIDGQDLHEEIANLYSFHETRERIADCFQLGIHNKCREAIGLPPKATDNITFTMRGRKDTVNISIPNVRVYLFESEVGFIEVECEYQTQNIEDYIDCNYFISEIKSEKNTFTMQRRISATEKFVSTFTMEDLIKNVLYYVGDDIRFFDNVGKEFNEKKPIIYSYLLLDKKPTNLEQIIYYARKNYKASYKPPASDFIIEGNPQVYQTFDNSYWGTSQYGTTNISFLVGDRQTDEFFHNNFVYKLNNSYFHLFLSVLHQKYATRLLTTKMSHLDKVVKDYEIMQQQACQAREYQAQSASLKFRAFFNVPSNIEHVNRYYDLVTHTFEIEKIYQSFNEDLNSIISLSDTYTAKSNEYQREKKELERKKIGVYVLLFGTIISAVTMLSSVWTVIEKIAGEPVRVGSPLMIIIFSALLLLITVAAANVFIRIHEIKEASYQLEEQKRTGELGKDCIRKKRRKYIRIKDKEHLQKESE
ncbi:MAG: hypothetical protein FWE45_00345 [Firmicutes bacterium]|nr:hypothetical protein [Bacillota bacterium]